MAQGQDSWEPGMNQTGFTSEFGLQDELVNQNSSIFLSKLNKKDEKKKKKIF